MLYFKTGQYPDLKDLSKPEQQRIVVDAIDQYARTTRWRFWIAILVVVASPFVPDSLPGDNGQTSWASLLFLGIGVVLFYVYLLWEINGPLFKAVQAYLADR